MVLFLFLLQAKCSGFQYRVVDPPDAEAVLVLPVAIEFPEVLPGNSPEDSIVLKTALEEEANKYILRVRKILAERRIRVVEAASAPQLRISGYSHRELDSWLRFWRFAQNDPLRRATPATVQRMPRVYAAIQEQKAGYNFDYNAQEFARLAGEAGAQYVIYHRASVTRLKDGLTEDGDGWCLPRDYAVAEFDFIIFDALGQIIAASREQSEEGSDPYLMHSETSTRGGCKFGSLRRNHFQPYVKLNNLGLLSLSILR